MLWNIYRDIELSKWLEDHNVFYIKEAATTGYYPDQLKNDIFLHISIVVVTVT